MRPRHIVDEVVMDYSAALRTSRVDSAKVGEHALPDLRYLVPVYRTAPCGVRSKRPMPADGYAAVVEVPNRVADNACVRRM